jgi:hypothetical protein
VSQVILPALLAKMAIFQSKKQTAMQWTLFLFGNDVSTG